MDYFGNIEDLKSGASVVTELYVIKLGDSILDVGEKSRPVYDTLESAKRALTNHVYANFCQGHYWHKGKDNTFAKEMGWERNGGKVSKSSEEFKQMAKDLTKSLLENGTIKIVRLV
jgi:hypothetical protein